MISSVFSTRASPTCRLRGRFLSAMLNSVQQGEAQTMSKCPGSNPSPYGSEEGRRLPLCLEPNEAAAADLETLEKDVKSQLTQRSLGDAKIFGRYLTASDVEARFVSCLKTSARGNSFIKLKVDLSRVRFWDAEQQPLEEPGDLASRECKVRAELKQVWLMSGQCGLLLEVTDLMLKEQLPQQCPF